MALRVAVLNLVAMVSATLLPSACSPEAHVMGIDFRSSPPEWQTAICLPDDPCKSIVDRRGKLLYHYNRGGREFCTHLGIEVTADARWQKQELESPRVPIVKTYFVTEHLEIIQHAFAMIPAGNSTARNDIVLVNVTNKGAEDCTLTPRLVVDTTLDFLFDPSNQRIIVDGHETVSTSLGFAGPVEQEKSRRVVPLEALRISPGESKAFFVVYCGGETIRVEPASIAEAWACRNQAVEFWQNEPSLPFGRVQVPDPKVQALVDSSIRNIWQAREIKKGLPAFQVGPTCYRGLWIVDGAFLLETATLLGAGQEARDGVAYVLTYQQPDGRIEVIPHYWKENGIVLWACVRHARLTRDRDWLESLWPQLERVAEAIRTLRRQTWTNESPLDDGLMPAGFPDGGIRGQIDEYSNTYWNLAGLRAWIDGARWLGKTDVVEEWQAEYDDFLSAFHKAARRDLQTDPHGNAYLPIRMDGGDLPQRGQWAFCHAVYPGQVFDRNDPFVMNTLAMLQATEREGMVYGTGWDATGIWTYFASFYGHAWLWQGRGDKAAEVLYAFGNHASPTLVWREEQSLQGEPFRKIGDMPHNWASAEFIRLVVHLLALDRGDELHLLEGFPPEWCGAGMTTALKGIETPFGPLDLSIRVDSRGEKATLTLQPLPEGCRAVVVHLPDGNTRKIPPQEGGSLKFRVPKPPQ
jgi:hypothetical protein